MEEAFIGVALVATVVGALIEVVKRTPPVKKAIERDPDFDGWFPAVAAVSGVGVGVGLHLAGVSELAETTPALAGVSGLIGGLTMSGAYKVGTKTPVTR